MLDTEESLILKLLTTSHLNVQERSLLPNKMIRYSFIRNLIVRHLNIHGWFPEAARKEAGDNGGGYIQLEQKEGLIIIHQNVENGLIKYSHIEMKYSSISDAIDEYLKLLEKSGLDGIKVDWKS